MSESNSSASITFIDSRLKGWETFAASAGEDTEVVLLDTARDGFTQIAEILAGRSGIGAVHVLSHGSSGTLWLGSTAITGDTLGGYTSALTSIGQSLTGSGDLLFYGCNVAAGEAGWSFINSLALFTGADVAASIDFTGSAALGGDWDLEARTGAIETQSLAVLDYSGLLAAPTVVPSGILDTGFSGDGIVTTDTGGFENIYDIALQSNGRIVAAGLYQAGGGPLQFALLRYLTDGTLDTTFSGDGVLNTLFGDDYAAAAAVSIQTDGKIIAAGQTLDTSPVSSDFALARYDTAGALDTTFGGDGKVTTDFGANIEQIDAITLQSDGKIVAVGKTNPLGYKLALARYLTDGSLDTTFSGDGKLTSSFGAQPLDVALQSNGKILVTGAADGGSQFLMARYNTDGSLDTSFSGDGIVDAGASINTGYALAVQPNGKILVAGTHSGQFFSHFAVARYNTDGSLDTTFDTDGMVTTSIYGEDQAFAIALQSDGRIVVSGRVASGGNYDIAVVRYNSNGSLDTTLDGDGKYVLAIGPGNTWDFAYDLALQSDGSIVAAGSSNDDFALIRLSGALADRSAVAGTGFNYEFNAAGAFIDPDGDALTYTATKADGSPRPAWLGFNVVSGTATFSGTPAFGDTGVVSIKVTATDPGAASTSDIFTITVSNAPTVNDPVDDQVANEDIPYTFQFAALDQPSAPFDDLDAGDSLTYNATKSDGSALPSWLTFTPATRTFSGTPQNADVADFIVKLTATDTYGNSVFDEFPFSVANVNDVPTLVPSGTLDTSFDGDGKVLTASLDFETPSAGGAFVQPDGKIVVVGSSDFTGGGAHVSVGRYNSNGSLDSSFDSDGIATTEVGSPLFAQYGRSVVVQGDGKILVGAEATSGGSTLLRYNTNGSLDSTFDGDGKALVAASSAAAHTVALQPDGKILVAGSDSNDFSLARLNTNGGLDTTFEGDGKVTTAIGEFADSVWSLAIQADGKIVAAGQSSDGVNSDFALARYNADGTLDTTFSGDGKVTLQLVAGHDAARDVAIQSDGKIVVMGTAVVASANVIALARYGTSGNLDTSFAGDGTLTTAGFDAAGVALQADDKILVAGHNNSGFALLRYNTDGSLDTSFSSDGIQEFNFGSGDIASDIALTPDGKILVAGVAVISLPSISTYGAALARVLPGGILDQRTLEDSAFNFAFASNVFADVDAGDTFTYTATKADNSALPGWLTFTPGTRTFSGTPTNGEVGNLDVKVTATDSATVPGSVSDVFRIVVANTNDAPTVANLIPDKNATEDSAFSFLFAAHNESGAPFADLDAGDSLTYSATKSDGSALPGWLSFNAGTREFGGTPANADVASFNVKVTATDSAGAAVSDVFALAVANTNDAPTAVPANQIADESRQINNPLSISFAAHNTAQGPFSDVDVGDVLTYTAVQRIGNASVALPAWLSFNPATRTFSGTPPPAAVGTLLTIRVIATDSGAASVFDDFILAVGTDADTKTGTGGDDTIDGGTGADTMIGGGGDDTYIVDNPDDVVVELNVPGTDLVKSSVSYTLPDGSFVENLTLTGAAAIDGKGNFLPNILEGNSATNRLDGGQGIDTLIGLGGDDTYVVDNANDLVIEAADGGTDSVEASNTVAGTTFLLADNAESMTLMGTEAINATGNAGANTLTGNSGNNHLIGGDGNDVLVGGDGDDRLDGGLGADSMFGGLGDDTYVVDNVSDTVTEGLNEGSDLIESSVSWTLGANTENLILTGTAAIDGTGNALSNQIIGNSANNVLTGGDGDDLLKGERGADTMAGGKGNDLYYVDNAADVVIEAAGEGTADQVFTSINFTLPDNVERVQIVDVNALFIVGNGLNNFFEGSDGDDVFEGGGGDDVLLGAGGKDRLDGGDGDDTLDGGTGVDTLLGGAGNDTYVIDSVADVLLEDADQGRDRAVVTLSSFDLRQTGAIEDLEFRGQGAFLGTGNTAENLIKGAGGSDTLRGREGNDTLDGGAGDNLLVGGSGLDTALLLGKRTDYQVAVVAGADDGIDFFTLFGLDPGDVVNLVSSNGRVDRLSGVERVIFLGDDLASDADDASVPVSREQLLRNVPVTGISNYVADLQGTGFLQGGATDDVLDGLDGEDRLLGGAGRDTLLGGEARDTLEGGAGDDVLNGGSGNDLMFGNAGNDTYVVDSLGDAVIENPNEGTADRVRSMLQEYSLASLAEVEILEAGQDADFAGTGNAKANRILGGAGNDTLDGGAGADRLQGGLGDDTYVIDSADTVVENANEGSDTIRTVLRAFSLSALNPDSGAALYANVENLVYAGNAALSFAGTGNARDNAITGAAGNDTLSGAAGNDTLLGNDGNDNLSGGAGDDILSGGAGADTLNGGAGLQDAARFAGARGDYSVTLLAGDIVQLAQGEVRDKLIGVERVVFDMGTPGALDDVALEVNALAGGLLYNIATYKNDTLTGTAGDDTISGLDGNDTLDGGAGNDTLIGGAGNDTYIVDSSGDTVTELANQGAVDLVKTGLDAHTLATNVEQLLYTGSGDFAGTGNASANKLTGGAGNDTLSGLAGNDTLIGGGGNDTLDGGLGADRMEGGAGNDTYTVSVVTLLDAAGIVLVAGDVVFEGTALLDSGGTDTVRSAASYTLGVNVENLVLVANALGVHANINGTGNALANSITGNSGNNILSGGTGNDTLNGGLGNDTLRGGPGNDIFVFDNLTSVDRVADFAAGDQIGLEDSVFSALEWTGGELVAGQFQSVTNIAQATAGMNLVYNSVTRQLFYDADGFGTGAAATLFAIFGTATSLTEADFMQL